VSVQRCPALTTVQKDRHRACLVDHHLGVEGVSDSDLQPISVDDEDIEHVTEFQYLGFIIAENNQIDAEVDKRTANSSKAFGTLR